MIQSLDSALAHHGKPVKAQWQSVCPECLATWEMHELWCVQVGGNGYSAEKPKKEKKEKKDDRD